MTLNINDKLHGFTVTGIRDIEEFEGQLIEMTHDKTGAGLVWAKSTEENKLFSVGFRTLPEDNTGVFHILEHSVLCGSEKYPVKEPFVELLKTSMNTFLNAMTYQDKTLYPVSSRMEADYLNLMSVYLDAVFSPAILKVPDIFYQEGWHIDTADEEPVYKGVVFNEMKGAMSDVDQVAERGMNKLLFPDTCYGYNSGGDPEAIPDLTYDDFISRYKRFYHPSNAYFYLDGDIPLEKTLGMIDSYLEKYERLGDIPQIDFQTPQVRNDVICYDAADEDGKALITYGRIAGTWEDRDKLLALSLLTEQLADSNESPLKRAVLSSGLVEDMELYISDGIAQPYIMIIFRGVDAGDEESARAIGDRLLEIIRETAGNIIRDRIPERDLTASVNQTSFRFRQYPEPQGLYRANAVFSSWLYGGDPALYLKSNEAIDILRENIRGDMLYELVSEYLADTSGYSRLILLPSASEGEKKAAEEAARIEGIMSGMSEAESGELEALNDHLLKWQQTPDSPEALASIPQLDLSEIKREPELIGTEVSSRDGVTILYHRLPSNGIVYINAYFPLTGLSLEELPSAALLTEFYKDLPTENYSVTDLQSEIKMYVGSISFGIDVLAPDRNNSVCTPALSARAAVLRENVSHAEDLIIEILTKTRFDDDDLMKELVTQIDDEGKRYAVSSGHRLAVSAARSHFTSRDAAAEAINGHTFIRFMHRVCDNYSEEIGKFRDFAQKLIEENVVRSSCIISITASEPADISRFIGLLNEGKPRPENVSYKTDVPTRLGLAVPASVSHAVEAYDLSRLGIRPRGSISVAANILSLSYLWNEIRVQGGAYGTSVLAGRTGGILCYSYRDPRPERSLEIYKTIPDFLNAFAEEDDMDISGFIISTIASTEPLISPASKGKSADDFYLSGFTDEDRIRVRREILETTPEELRSWHDAFAGLASDGSICVIGPKSALESCPDLEIVNI